MLKAKVLRFRQMLKLEKSETSFIFQNLFTIGGRDFIFMFWFIYFFRLALYVYEYLLHVGAQKAAQTFLSEVLKIKFLLKFEMLHVKCMLMILYFVIDPMGEKYHVGWTPWFSPFMVVVSEQK